MASRVLGVVSLLRQESAAKVSKACSVAERTGKKKRCRRDRRRSVCERERERSLNLVVDVQSIVMEACKERERGRGKT